MPVYFVAVAQNSGAKGKMGFVSFSAGPSFPIGDFSSSSGNNDQAGFAKTGFNLDLYGGYHLASNVGIAASFFYSRYGLDNSLVSGTTASVDHWQYYGLVVGPMITEPLSDNILADFTIMSGIVNANSPKLTYNGEELVSEDWTVAVPVRLSADLRFQFAKNGYFITGVNYIYLDPKFKFTSLGETVTAHQKITTVNLTAGIGFGF